ncbi:hypothetical protein EBB07_16585 [Paenibacillaceae bacterium]|nr:hypothetical protein EBB07_16585 [Paenibacillaceae bacterium]
MSRADDEEKLQAWAMYFFVPKETGTNGWFFVNDYIFMSALEKNYDALSFLCHCRGLRIPDQWFDRLQSIGLPPVKQWEGVYNH